MTLEIVNKLFIELSQFATAETAKERLYKDALERIRSYPVHSEPVGSAMEMADIADRTLQHAKDIPKTI